MTLFGEAVAHMPSPGLSELLGVRLKQLRKEQGLTQEDLGRRTGVATSTISKVENNQLSPTFETLLKLAEGLEIDIAELLAVGDRHDRRTRRAITSKGQGEIHETPHYTYELLCTELVSKKMHPLVARLKANSVSEFGPLFRHPGEELFYVLAGQVELHTEHYRPQRLSVGDCAYFDSTMGHACICAGDEDAMIFWVSTVPRPDS
jgi:transcriptional regulator with XRE-family HTH domain